MSDQSLSCIVSAYRYSKMNDLHLGLSSFDRMTRADKDALKIRLEFASSTVHLQII